MSRCPGQDSQQWGHDAIYDVECPACRAAIEFFKDEVKHRCPSCGEMVFNDRLDLGCARWCPSAAACLGADLEQALALTAHQESRRDDLKMLLDLVPPDQPKVRELFKTLYSEYRGEDKLFDTNRLFTVKERDPRLFESATEAYKAFLDRKKTEAET
jgi:hypothetical protein